MATEREIGRIIKGESKELRDWYNKEKVSGLTAEYSSGHRFAVFFQFDPNSPTERGTYPLADPSIATQVGSVQKPLVPKEQATRDVPVVVRRVSKAAMWDKEARRSIDLKALLPHGYDFVIANLSEEMTTLLANAGIDLNSPEVRQKFGRSMPIGPHKNSQTIVVPIFRFYQDHWAKRDVFGEQLVNVLGATRALARGVERYYDLQREAKEFMASTLGGRLYLLGEKLVPPGVR